ncbi:MAG: hypothetical protein ABSB41_09165 [Anaerolineales bacterium]|jgi:hypothetical protein
MFQWMNKRLDRISEYLAVRKGLLPFLGLLLIAANYGLQFFLTGWVIQTNLLLHVGLVVAILGLMLAWAL